MSIVCECKNPKPIMMDDGHHWCQNCGGYCDNVEREKKC